jgi:pyruvate carboxylase
MRPGETIHITLGKGKQMILTYLFDSAPDAKGVRTLHFAYNGKQFLMKIMDNSLKNKVKVVPKADPDDPNQIGMPLSGNVVKINVQPGDTIKTGEVMVVTEAMKMETNVKAPFSGTIKSVTAKVGDQLDDHDLLLTIEPK